MKILKLLVFILNMISAIIYICALGYDQWFTENTEYQGIWFKLDENSLWIKYVRGFIISALVLTILNCLVSFIFILKSHQCLVYVLMFASLFSGSFSIGTLYIIKEYDKKKDNQNIGVSCQLVIAGTVLTFLVFFISMFFYLACRKSGSVSPLPQVEEPLVEIQADPESDAIL